MENNGKLAQKLWKNLQIDPFVGLNKQKSGKFAIEVPNAFYSRLILKSDRRILIETQGGR